VVEEDRLESVAASASAAVATARVRKLRSSHRAIAWLGLTPFLLFTVAFLGWPTATLLESAFTKSNGGFTTKYIGQILHQPYIGAFRTSIELSALTAALGGILGLVVCYAAVGPGGPRWLRSVVVAFSGVASQFGGIPIAFAFISTLGTVGLVTVWLRDVGLNLYGLGFSLFNFTGLCVVYLYLQIPLMVLIVAPAVEGLRQEWRDASENLGARNWQYWRYVGLPILAPAVMSGVILLFGNAFAAYASAYALTSGTVNLVPIVIGEVADGNVIADPQLGYAMATGMVVVIMVTMVGYVLLDRRTSRWLR
jgi:putative spermidine/putrescine transport system permease protein